MVLKDGYIKIFIVEMCRVSFIFLKEINTFIQK